MAVLYQRKLPFNLIALENNIKTKELGFFKVCIVCTFAIEEDPLFLFFYYCFFCYEFFLSLTRSSHEEL